MSRSETLQGSCGVAYPLQLKQCFQCTLFAAIPQQFTLVTHFETVAGEELKLKAFFYYLLTVTAGPPLYVYMHVYIYIY